VRDKAIAAAEGARPARLGRYEILRHLATGGMAEIYLARVSGIEGFEKQVVVKRILPRLSGDRELVSMFLDEARIAATLHHANIVQVFDIGRDEGGYFFAMEFLRGEDAGTVLQRLEKHHRQLPLEHALCIVLGLCAGLHYAHELRGLDGRPLAIIHRDVSPQNVIITRDGGVKLVDFGIAKAACRLVKTRQGSLRGKIRYMSPEQCRSDPLDRRSDIFALAIVLWELTTGRPLYTGEGEFDIMKAIVESDAPRPSTVKPDYPVELERIVMKGLSRSRANRYATAQAMQLDLEAFVRARQLAVSSVALSTFMNELFGDTSTCAEVERLETAPATEDLASALARAAASTSVPRSGRRRALIAAAAAALVVGGLVSWRMYAKRSSPAPVASTPIAPPAIAPAPPIVSAPTPAPAIEHPATHERVEVRPPPKRIRASAHRSEHPTKSANPMVVPLPDDPDVPLR